MLFMQVVTRSHIFVSHYNIGSKTKYRIILPKAQNWPNRIILYPHKFLALRYWRSLWRTERTKEAAGLLNLDQITLDCMYTRTAQVFSGYYLQDQFWFCT